MISVIWVQRSEKSRSFLGCGDKILADTQWRAGPYGRWLLRTLGGAGSGPLIEVPRDGMWGSPCPPLPPTPSPIPHGMEKALGGWGWLMAVVAGQFPQGGYWWQWWNESHTLRDVQGDQRDRTPLLWGKTGLGLFSLEKALGRSYCGLLVLK